MVLNRRCLPEHPDTALRSTYVSWAGGLAAPTVGVFSAYCSGTPSPPSGCTSARVLRDDALVLRGGATGASSLSDHLDIAMLCIRVVRSSPNEMPPSLRGATSAVFLFFQAGLAFAALFPKLSPIPRGDSPSDQHLHL